MQGWVVLELTHSDGWVGLAAGLPAIPVIALAMFGGAIADRFNRRVIQMWSFTLLAITGFLTGILIDTDVIQLWHILVIAFPVAVVTTLRMTAGAALVVDIVGRERVFGANAVSTAVTNIGRFAGPAIGGWILAQYRADKAFYFVGFALLLAAGLMWFVKVENPAKAKSDKSLIEDFKLGMRYISGTPELRWLAVLAISLIAAEM